MNYKLKVFISQPMGGKSRKEILATRKDIIKSIKSHYGGPCKLKFINSYFNYSPHTSYSPLYCLGRSLKLMSRADLIYFADGWENARGCRIERACAESYGFILVEDSGIVHSSNQSKERSTCLK